MPLARHNIRTYVHGCQGLQETDFRSFENFGSLTLAGGVDLLYSYCRVGFLSVSK